MALVVVAVGWRVAIQLIMTAENYIRVLSTVSVVIFSSGEPFVRMSLSGQVRVRFRTSRHQFARCLRSQHPRCDTEAKLSLRVTTG